MSKAHTERRKVNTISVEAERLALVSCPHQDVWDIPCDDCRRQCQREIEDSQARASARRLGK